MDRPLPTLAQFLGDGTRAEGHEEWLRETLAMEGSVSDPNEAACLRLIKLLSIACMEAAKQERETYGREDADTVKTLARAAGVSVLAPILCLARDDAALGRLGKMVVEDFRYGVKTMTAAAVRTSALAQHS